MTLCPLPLVSPGHSSCRVLSLPSHAHHHVPGLWRCLAQKKLHEINIRKQTGTGTSMTIKITGHSLNSALALPKQNALTVGKWTEICRAFSGVPRVRLVAVACELWSLSCFWERGPEVWGEGGDSREGRAETHGHTESLRHSLTFFSFLTYHFYDNFPTSSALHLYVKQIQANWDEIVLISRL